MKEHYLLYALEGKFKEGDEVIDCTAEVNDWPDKEGTVQEVDGSHVLVKYISGNVRAKMHINLRLKDPEAEKERIDLVNASQVSPRN
jgi:hypothetical protein